ncbi:MAG: type I 3-dehydroquinate dehydratase [Candidatus Hydrothermarchaeales archaeon]
MRAFLDKKPAICAAVIGTTVDDFLAVVGGIEGADLIEIRADGLKDPDPAKVKKLLKSVGRETELPFILTNRVMDEGGAFMGSEAERLLILKKNMGFADAVDIELSTEKKKRDKLIEKAKDQGIPVIVSAHDFEKTPGEEAMLKTIAEEFKAGASVAKIAVMADSKEDVLKLLNVTAEAVKLGNVCTIAMGEAGKLSRIVAPLFGSCITYASVGEPTAPGQLTVKEVRRLIEVLM